MFTAWLRHHFLNCADRVEVAFCGLSFSLRFKSNFLEDHLLPQQYSALIDGSTVFLRL